MAISPDDPVYALGVRARPALDQAAQFVTDVGDVAGYGVASGLAGLLDLGLRPTKALLEPNVNFARGLVGAGPIQFDPYALQRSVESWGPPEAAYRWGVNAFPRERTIEEIMANAVPDPTAPLPAPLQDFSNVVARVHGPVSAPTDLELGITGPITSGSVPPPVASTTVLPSADATGRPGYGAGAVGMPSVVASTRGLPVPMQCASGVCRPDIRSGNFYANAEQAGIARNYPIGTTEFDRYAAEANRQRMLAGGAAGLVRGEQADRARILQDLRVTPEYGEAYAVALQNAGGRRDVAQALTDQMFVGQDPTLTLGLTENNTAPLIDEASSQAAALAMAAGDATLANRLTEAAAGVGYYGLAGGLPYGLAADQPAVAAPGAVLQLQNVPSSLSAPARAAAGGSIGELTRRDAGEQALQAASAANASAFARQLQALASLERNSLESFEMREAIRARYRASGGGNLTDEQLFALAAQASGR